MKERIKALLQNSVRVVVPNESRFDIWNGTLSRFKIVNGCLIIYNYWFIVKRSYAPGQWTQVFIWDYNYLTGGDL